MVAQLPLLYLVMVGVVSSPFLTILVYLLRRRVALLSFQRPAWVSAIFLTASGGIILIAAHKILELFIIEGALTVLLMATALLLFVAHNLVAIAFILTYAGGLQNE
jgi:hypothetical protein